MPRDELFQRLRAYWEAEFAKVELMRPELRRRAVEDQMKVEARLRGWGDQDAA